MPEFMLVMEKSLDVFIPDPELRQAVQAKIQELLGGFIKGSWDNPFEA